MKVLLLDIGNTNTHVGLANEHRVVRQSNLSTGTWFSDNAVAQLRRFVRNARIDGTAYCSVVPQATPAMLRAIAQFGSLRNLALTPRAVRGIGINYPKPRTIGPDRLANAVAARHCFSAPVIVVDFGTAVTFDVVDRHGAYIGGIIAPGLAAMTDYLHEKTALLPRIRIREVHQAVGKSTHEAMLIGAVRGYRGLVRELIAGLKGMLGVSWLPVVATGGYGKLMAAGLPEITAVVPNLTLDGLRLIWLANSKR